MDSGEIEYREIEFIVGFCQENLTLYKIVNNSLQWVYIWWQNMLTLLVFKDNWYRIDIRFFVTMTIETSLSFDHYLAFQFLTTGQYTVMKIRLMVS